MARKRRRKKPTRSTRVVKGVLRRNPASGSWTALGALTPIMFTPALGFLLPSLYSLLLSYTMEYPRGSAGSSFTTGLRWGGVSGLALGTLAVLGALLFGPRLLSQTKKAPGQSNGSVAGIKSILGPTLSSKLMNRNRQQPPTLYSQFRNNW